MNYERGGAAKYGRAMANQNDKFSENAPGPWYVDSNCIICGMCSEIVPSVFATSPDGHHNYVHRQPASPEERLGAQEAMDACPVEAIGNDGA